MRPLRRITVKLLLLGAASLVSLVGAEVALRLFYPRVEIFYSLAPGQRQTFNADPVLMPGVEGLANYQVGSHGVRGRPFGDDGAEYRVLAIGGSTTECLYLHESESWTYLVERGIGNSADGRSVWIGNVGRSGLTSRDHVVQLKYHTLQYPRIDAVVILLGINDLTVALAQGDDYRLPPPITSPPAESEQIREAFVSVPGRLHSPASYHLLTPDAPWFKATAIWQLLKKTRMVVESRLAGAGLVQDQAGQAYAEWRANRRSATRILRTAPDLGPPLEEFRRNLDEIARLSELRQIRTILLTQPSLWRTDNTEQEKDLFWLGGIGEDFQTAPGREYYSVGVLAEAMEAYNDTTLEACARHASLECLDLARALPKDQRLFYDDAHFSEAGSLRVSQVVIEYLLERAPFLNR